MTKPNIHAALVRARGRSCRIRADSTRALSTTTTTSSLRRQNIGRKSPLSSRHSSPRSLVTWNLTQKRDPHHIFPAPEPLRFPAGHNTLLPAILAANNLVLPPAAEFAHGYGDPDDIYNSPTGLDYNIKTRPLRVASRTPLGALTAEERIVPFFVSHHPHVPNDDKGGLDQHPDGGVSSIRRSSTDIHFGPPKPVGWLIPEVASAISRDHLRHFQRDSASPWDIRYFEGDELDGTEVASSAAEGVAEGGTWGQVVKSVAFADWVNDGGRHARTLYIERLLLDWKRKKVFGELLKGWSEEQYPVFNHPSQSAEPLAFAVDRAALPLFGLANYGVMLTAYIHDPATNETKLWIPRRSMTKKNYPGKLDVTAGGGLRLGDSPLSAILREAAEEALLDIDYLSMYIRSVGTAPYLHRSSTLPTIPLVAKPNSDTPPCTNSGPSRVPQPHNYSLSEHPSLVTSPILQQYIMPGHYYLYELSLPVDLTTRPQTNLLDGDVASFHLLPLEEVLDNLVKGKFKRSSVLAIVDFLVRGGWISEENDIYYADVVRALRGGLGGGGGVPVPWKYF